ncbi:hypothetical protein GCM10023187_26060 [Nibrella viscosa]|uniref:SnoaL-like domain-containing protein n=1 Tax=Nibrella viscosa TaxID=1084524 RepID=A0ABP8KGD2_9BACT
MKPFFTILFAIILVSQATAQTTEIEKSAREFYKALAKRNLDKAATYIADDAIDYGQGPTPIKGREAIMKSIADFFMAFPETSISVEGVAVEGNKVYIRNTFSGVQKAPLAGVIPPTNKLVTYQDVDILEFNRTGKIVAHWASNPTAVLDQLGYHAYTNPNTMAVMDGYKLFGKGDIAGLLASCTDDVVWNVLDSPAAGVARVYRGKKEVGQFFTNLAAGLQITQFTPFRFFADGDEVIALVNCEFKMPGDPKLYKVSLAHHFTMRDGRIASFKEIVDKPQEVVMAAK